MVFSISATVFSVWGQHMIQPPSLGVIFTTVYDLRNGVWPSQLCISLSGVWPSQWCMTSTMAYDLYSSIWPSQWCTSFTALARFQMWVYMRTTLNVYVCVFIWEQPLTCMCICVCVFIREPPLMSICVWATFVKLQFCQGSGLFDICFTIFICRGI